MASSSSFRFEINAPDLTRSAVTHTPGIDYFFLDLLKAFHCKEHGSEMRQHGFVVPDRVTAVPFIDEEKDAIVYLLLGDKEVSENLVLQVANCLLRPQQLGLNLWQIIDHQTDEQVMDNANIYTDFIEGLEIIYRAEAAALNIAPVPEII